MGPAGAGVVLVGGFGGALLGLGLDLLVGGVAGAEGSVGVRVVGDLAARLDGARAVRQLLVTVNRSISGPSGHPLPGASWIGPVSSQRFQKCRCAVGEVSFLCSFVADQLHEVLNSVVLGQKIGNLISFERN